jgi:hypothetical protein
MPKAERLNPTGFPKNCPKSGTVVPGEWKTFSTFKGIQCHNIFHWEGKTFPSFQLSSIPKKRPSADIAHGRPIPRPAPMFGTRIAKAGL